MFVARAVWQPATGRFPELSEALMAIGRDGQRVTVAQRLTGPMAFTVNRAFESLSDYEQAISQPPSLERVARLGALVADAPQRELWETTTDLPTGPATAFTVRFTYEPAQGDAAEVRGLIEDLVKTRNSAEARGSCWVLVGGGPVAVSTVWAFSDLASVQAARAQNLADPSVREFARKLAPLLARPAQAPEIFRILQPAM